MERTFSYISFSEQMNNFYFAKSKNVISYLNVRAYSFLIKIVNQVIKGLKQFMLQGHQSSFPLKPLSMVMSYFIKIIIYPFCFVYKNHH